MGQSTPLCVTTCLDLAGGSNPCWSGGFLSWRQDGSLGCQDLQCDQSRKTRGAEKADHDEHALACHVVSIFLWGDCRRIQPPWRLELHFGAIVFCSSPVKFSCLMGGLLKPMLHTVAGIS